MNRVDYDSFVGTTHRNLTVLSINGTWKSGRTVFPAYLVKCVCGKEKRLCAKSVIYKLVMSCGCRTGTKVGRYNKTGNKNPKWRGGSFREKDGRTLIYTPNHPFPNHSGLYVYRYRLVVEKHLKRYLEPGELVHHINGDCTDDRLKNLVVTNKSDHARFHRVPGRRGFVRLTKKKSLRMISAEKAKMEL